MHLRPINPADRPPATPLPPTGAGASGEAPAVSGVSIVRPVSPVEDSPAGRTFDPTRTGVDLSALLRVGADQLVAREQPGAVQLAAVLERARAALVRGDPGSTLAALDEAWDGALRTEGGWYYRAAALALLGLPGEADRVLSQALVPRGGSMALLFLQSVVRSGMSDTAGARDALASALARSPAEPLLQAWNAVLTARTGDRAGALQLLALVPAGEETSTLLAWARQAVSSATVNAARASTPWSAAAVAVAPVEASLTPLQQALQEVGGQLAHGSLADVRRDVRTLLRSVATGGAFDQSSRPESLAAVRSVLAAMLGAIADTNNAVTGHTSQGRAAATRSFDARTDPHGSWHIAPHDDATIHHPTPASAVMRSALLSAIRAGDLALAENLLQKLPVSESGSIVDTLKHVVAGARGALAAPQSSAEFVSDTVRPNGEPGSVQSRIARTADHLIAPVRLGLSLLVAPSQRAEANAAIHGDRTDTWDIATPAVRGGADATAASPSSALAGTVWGAAAAGVPFDASGTAAALAAGAAGMRHTTGAGGSGTSHGAHAAPGYDDMSLADSFESGKRLRALALGCMALAFAAMIYGYGAAAIALAGGASWLALRSTAVAAAARRAAIRAAQEEPGH